MKRPMLVSGAAIGLSSLVLVLAGIKALPFLLLGAVSVFIIYFIKPLKLKEYIIIPAFCICVILSCIFFGAFHLNKIAPATKLHNTTTDISGKIITTPQETSYGTTFIIKTDKIGNESQTIKIQVLLSNNNYADFKLYDYVSLPNTKLTVVKNDYNNPDAISISDGVILEATSGTLNVLWEREKTPYYHCLHFKERITEQINAYLTEYDAGFLLGMLFGDKAQLDPDIKNDFRVTGIAHLLAVSGLHTGVWCAYIIAFFKLLKVKEKVRNIICLMFLCGLCIVSAFTPSVMRASIMMAVALLAPFFDEENDTLNSLGFAVSVLILHNPYIITSVSFLLSVSATAGVLLSGNITQPINQKLFQIKYKINLQAKKKINSLLLDLAIYLSTNIIVSVFAGLFTLPVTAFYFRTFSIISPLTNIICVKPAFWGMLSGIISTATSFIPFDVTHDLAILFFKITRLILRFVTGVANFIGSFKYCSFPVHREHFLLAIIIITIISLIGFLFYKRKPNTKTTKLLASVCSVVMTLSIVLPCTSITPSTLIITDSENGLTAGVRTGLYWAFFNCGTQSDEIPYFSLPSATSEALEYIYISAYDTKTNKLTRVLTNSAPETTILTNYVKDSYTGSDTEFPPNTIITNHYSFNLNNEINVSTIDTAPAGCVIIEGNEKKAFLCYGNKLDLEYIFNTYGRPDVLVLSETLPDSLPEKVDTLIISSNSDVIINQNIPTLKTQCNKFYTTAENGDVKILL